MRLLGRSRLRGEDNIKKEHQNNFTGGSYKRKDMYSPIMLLRIIS